MKFELLNKFIEQKAERNAGHEELIRRQEAAFREVQSLKAEYETVIRESLLAGKDSTKALDALHERIEPAEKAYARRQQEVAVYGTVIKEKITAEDVVASFNSEFATAFEKTRLGPVYKRLVAAKQEIIDAVLEYHSVNDEFNSERHRARGEISPSHYYKLRDVGHRTQVEADHYFLKVDDLRSIERGVRPPSFNPERKFE